MRRLLFFPDYFLVGFGSNPFNPYPKNTFPSAIKNLPHNTRAPADAGAPSQKQTSIQALLCRRLHFCFSKAERLSVLSSAARYQQNHYNRSANDDPPGSNAEEVNFLLFRCTRHPELSFGILQAFIHLYPIDLIRAFLEVFHDFDVVRVPFVRAFRPQRDRFDPTNIAGNQIEFFVAVAGKNIVGRCIKRLIHIDHGRIPLVSMHEHIDFRIGAGILIGMRFKGDHVIGLLVGNLQPRLIVSLFIQYRAVIKNRVNEFFATGNSVQEEVFEQGAKRI